LQFVNYSNQATSRQLGTLAKFFPLQKTVRLFFLARIET